MIHNSAKSRELAHARSTTQSSRKEGARTNSASTEFESFLRNSLPGGTKKEVSEEELFAAVVSERLSTLVGRSAARKYTRAFNDAYSQMNEAARGRSVSVEKVALSALKTVINTQGISEEQANKIYSQSFAASNLDRIKDSLYDGNSRKGDPTKAVKEFNIAMRMATRALSTFDGGTGTWESRTLATARATGQKAPAIGQIGAPIRVVA